MTARTVAHRVAVDGWSLAVQAFPAVGTPRGVVIAGHAMMCDQRTLDRPRGAGLASTLAAAGLHTYTFDARGHGQSGPRPADGGRYSYEDIVEGDVPAMVRWAKARHPDLPLAIVGHSLVGHAAMLWLGQNPDAPVDAICGLAPNLWARHLEPDRRVWWRKRATIEAWAAFTRVYGYYPARRFGTGTDDEAAEYVHDFVRYIRHGIHRASDGADYLAGLRNVQAPVLALVGSRDDFLCRPAACSLFLANIPQHELRVVDGANHMSLVTSETHRDTWCAAADWLLEVLPPAADRDEAE